jgi:Putative MetA-pathway of phenol degradation
MNRAAVAACFAIPALFGTTAPGQVYAGTDARAAAAVSMAPSALSFAQQPPQGTAEQPRPPAEERPLTISTNRPSFTDTTGFVPSGHLQLEMGYTFTLRDRDGVETRTHNGPEVLFRVPLIEDRLELQFGTSGYVYSHFDDGTTSGSVDGFSDMTVGARLKVVDENGWVPRLCLQLATTIGAGSDDISNQDVEPVFKVIWSYDLGQGWTMYGNFGVGYLTAGSDRFTQGQGGVCVGYTINDAWSVYGEYYMFGPNTKGSDAAHYADVGAAYLLTARIQLDARVGCGLNEEANNFFTGAGISFLF